MNHDDQNKPDLSTLIDPELEARIVAWISGEASPFESAELTRLTNEKPELAIFKRRIETVSGLVGEAIRPEKEPLRLAPERRTKLLHALGATEFKPNSASATNTVVLPLAYSQSKKRKDRRRMLAIAASVTVGFFTLISFRQYQSGFEMAKESKKSRQESIQVELPVAENVERRAQADGEKRREIASEYAAADAATRTQEREAVERALSARDAAKQLAEHHYRQTVTRTKPSQSVAEVALPIPAPASAPVFDSNNSASTFAGSRVRTELKDLGANFGLIGGTGADKKSDASLTTTGLAEESQVGGKATVQTTTLNPAAEAIVLSPFEVSSNNEKGYAAQDVLAAVQARQAGKEFNGISADVPLEKPKAPAPAQTFTEINAAKEPVSTFSLHVSDVSFRVAQAALARGETLDRASIRPEEFYNAFSYGDPTPALDEKVSCRIEQAAHPFVQQRNLVRIAVKVAASGRDAAQPLHLTVLLDTSGSMEREDRAATIQGAMNALTSLLGPNDRLTLIGFARQPRLLAEALTGDQAAQVMDLIKNTPAEGGTNLEEALKLGSELARRQFNASAQNRIVLLTDGAANLGNANPAQLAASIEALRQQGIAFDACGVGLEGLDDGMLENLTRKGDGRYYVLNSPEAADAGFAKQLAGAFRPAAENVKLQVRFNPARVGHYRLIGFEKHRLNEEDFRNDKVDAAELAAEEAAVAVYQVEALPQGEGELGEVYVRFRDTASGNMVERSWTLNYDAQAPAFDRATPSIQLAGTAALLAEKLQGGDAAAAINLGDLAPIVNKLRSQYANEPRVQELVTMFEQARKLAGE